MAKRRSREKLTGGNQRRRSTADHAPRGRSIDPALPVIGGIRITHPGRLIYPDLGISKFQLARYYERIGDWIVPHVAARPLTLVHCPAGLAASASPMLSAIRARV